MTFFNASDHQPGHDRRPGKAQSPADIAANISAVFDPGADPERRADGDRSLYPAVTIDGAMVFSYAEGGVLTVSVDLDAALSGKSPVWAAYGLRSDRIPVRVTVQGTEVFCALPEPEAPATGQCTACRAAGVPLVAALAPDNCEQLVCAECHRNPGIPTVSLAALDDSRPVYVLTRGDIARLAGREVTEDEARRVGKALGHSTIQEAVNGAVEQVCGLPDEYDPDEPSRPAARPAAEAADL